MFYLTTHSTHFIYGYMVSDIWLRTILIVRKETHCRHIGYSYRLTARVLLYAHTPAFVTPVVVHWLEREIAQWVHHMKDRSDDSSHHEQCSYHGATSRSLILIIIITEIIIITTEIIIIIIITEIIRREIIIITNNKIRNNNKNININTNNNNNNNTQ